MSSSFQPDQTPIEDGEESYSSSTFSSSTSSSGGSSPFPPLPDEVLRSFQVPDQLRVDARSDNAVEAHIWGSGRSVQQSVNAGDHRDAPISANDENQTQIQRRNDLSEYDICDLRLIHAHYKTLASKHRERMIREIEANCEELGLNVRQQDWAALLKTLTAAGATRSRPGINANQRDFSQDEFEEQGNPPRDVNRFPVSEVAYGSETTATIDGSVNSSSDMPAVSEASLRSLWAPRGRKRAYSQLEQQHPYAADDHENGQAEAVMVQARSRALIRSLHSGDAGNVPRRGRDSSIVFVNGVPKRTAWSVVLDRYPDEVAMVFRAGQRPENSQVRSMLDLPAINLLVDNPRRMKHHLPWRIHHLRVDRQTQHLLAVLIQITGVLESDPCEKCERGGGLWKGCYTKPSAARLATQTKVCANCMIHGFASQCRWNERPALL